MSYLLIHSGEIINEGERFQGYVLIKDDRIEAVEQGEYRGNHISEQIDASGMIVIPGVIDDQVHFREPGLTAKADIHSESLAAIAGGVTSFMDMPNTLPPTTTLELLEQKYELGGKNSPANYSFYFGATNDNIKELVRIDPKTVCGVKVFMGSSTGNMLVDNERSLSAIFAESPLLIATHCEDEAIIQQNIALYKKEYPIDAPANIHPLVRTAQACYRSSALAAGLADRYGSRLHILHLSTERELSLLDKGDVAGKKITAEVCVHHLWFSDKDYAIKGNFIKWNPSIKSIADRNALRQGLIDNKIDIVATDHAPHLKQEKMRSYWEAPSGGPLVQHSLVVMLEMVRSGVFTTEQVVYKMCHAPALCFGIKERGFLRKGYYADIAIVDPATEWTISTRNILYKCGWSPFESEILHNKVAYTIVNGNVVNRLGEIDDSLRGCRLEFT